MSIADAHLLDALPLRIRGVEVQAPVLTLFGEQWSLTLACPWEGAVRGRTLTWDDVELEDQAWALVGEELVAVQQHGRSVSFEFTAGTLCVTPDTDLEPWVLELPGGLLVGKVL